ncbi:hypothetical protein [Actinomyces sp. oral taxon 171]|uniref:hypothetical protein n=1 Tax=Actinomyces sp. oral taxon 171 TaxID=706438 RepID=UPI0001F62059|nr:hypothetical protein [Actinomyces sp. oral taxon 171]EFW27779.1 hypothetical protein HMPREF9057_00822 [Actinomyces sp. oral taxon 171 str. F0337]QCT32736.1 hypothetical protein FBF36_04000 [Actinomyces sp. oral taxon 171 str. F0337]
MSDNNDSESHSGRRIAFWMMFIVVAAILPVLAQIPALSRFSTALWLSSMPLCVLGFAMLVKEAAAHRASRQDLD